MKIGSRMMFKSISASMIRLGVSVSPVARMALLPMMGMTRNTMPVSQMRR